MIRPRLLSGYSTVSTSSSSWLANLIIITCYKICHCNVERTPWWTTYGNYKDVWAHHRRGRTLHTGIEPSQFGIYQPTNYFDSAPGDPREIGQQYYNQRRRVQQVSTCNSRGNNELLSNGFWQRIRRGEDRGEHLCGLSNHMKPKSNVRRVGR